MEQGNANKGALTQAMIRLELAKMQVQKLLEGKETDLNLLRLRVEAAHRTIVKYEQENT